MNAFAASQGALVSFNKDARREYLKFARSPEALWSANFRDLNGSVVRMATLSRGGRITVAMVKDEIDRLRARWADKASAVGSADELASIIPEDELALMDQFDRLQLIQVLRVCNASRSVAEAGRRLYDVSRLQKSSRNDSHRLRTYLKKFGLQFGADGLRWVGRG
ncbi:MAG: hypothetical protein AAFQ99_08730 [Pseudomonadota bacterium]